MVMRLAWIQVRSALGVAGGRGARRSCANRLDGSDAYDMPRVRKNLEESTEI